MPRDYHQHEDSFVCSLYLEAKLVMICINLYTDFLVSLDIMDLYSPLWFFQISWVLLYVHIISVVLMQIHLIITILAISYVPSRWILRDLYPPYIYVCSLDAARWTILYQAHYRDLIFCSHPIVLNGHSRRLALVCLSLYSTLGIMICVGQFISI